MRQTVSLCKSTKKTKAGTVQYYELRWYDRLGKRCSQNIGIVGEMSAQQARNRKRAKENEFDDCPGIRDAGKLRLKEFTDRYFELRSHKLAKASVIRYKGSVNYLLHFFGENRIVSNITPDDAESFKAALAQGRISDASKTKRKQNEVTVNTHMRQVKAIFGFGVKNLKKLSSNPFLCTVDNVKKSKKNWHYITRDEFFKVYEACGEKYKLIVALCRLAGVRRMEAVELTWDDVNFDTGKICIIGKDDWQPKDRETRYIPLFPELEKILLEAHSAAPEKAIKVCPDVDEPNLNRDILRAIKRAGVTVWKKPMHSMRKSAITDWARKFPMHVVRQWAGHGDIDTTAEYYTQTLESDYKAANKQSIFTDNIGTENQTENAKQETGQK